MLREPFVRWARSRRAAGSGRLDPICGTRTRGRRKRGPSCAARAGSDARSRRGLASRVCVEGLVVGQSPAAPREPVSPWAKRPAQGRGRQGQDPAQPCRWLVTSAAEAPRKPTAARSWRTRSRSGAARASSQPRARSAAPNHDGADRASARRPCGFLAPDPGRSRAGTTFAQGNLRVHTGASPWSQCPGSWSSSRTSRKLLP